MKPGRYASIDVGTNSVKMILVDLSEQAATLVLERSAITRLGEGMNPSNSRMLEVPMRRTLEALEEYAQIAADQGAQGMAAVGTAALRDALNRDEFLRRVQERAGLAIEVISGDEEARLSYLAVRRDPVWRNLERMAVIDVGGGSTEVILGEKDAIVSRMSVNVGAVKLTENYLRSDPPTVAQLTAASQTAQEGFARVPMNPDAEGVMAVGVGGTITTLAALDRGGASELDSLHGYTLSLDALEDQIVRLSALSIAQRKELRGLDPKRADIILGGAILLLQALERLKSPSLAVSVRGLRWGVLYDRFL